MYDVLLGHVTVFDEVVHNLIPMAFPNVQFRTHYAVGLLSFEQAIDE
jgi:hypothetical protein